MVDHLDRQRAQLLDPALNRAHADELANPQPPRVDDQEAVHPLRDTAARAEGDHETDEDGQAPKHIAPRAGDEGVGSRAAHGGVAAGSKALDLRGGKVNLALAPAIAAAGWSNRSIPAQACHLQ